VNYRIIGKRKENSVVQLNNPSSGIHSSSLSFKGHPDPTTESRKEKKKRVKAPRKCSTNPPRLVNKEIFTQTQAQCRKRKRKRENTSREHPGKEDGIYVIRVLP